MSHVVRIKTQLKDQNLVAKAVASLGLTATKLTDGGTHIDLLNQTAFGHLPPWVTRQGVIVSPSGEIETDADATGRDYGVVKYLKKAYAHCVAQQLAEEHGTELAERVEGERTYYELEITA